MKRNSKNKLLALLLAVIMLMSVLPMAGMAGQETVPEEECSFSQDCTATIHQEGCPSYGTSQSSTTKAAEKLSAADTPKEAAQPKETEQPQETEQPEETEQPKETEQPEETEQPKETAQP